MVNWMDYKNYRVHGFRDGRWLIHDRVALFKRMIALRDRDLDVLKYNYDREVERSGKSLTKLKKNAPLIREDVRNALLGNRKMIYTTFSQHFRLFLAYGNSSPDNIAENLEQLNFNKRKILDKHKFQKKKTMERYKDEILRISDMDDKMLMSAAGAKSRAESKIQELSNTIQATRIRTNGAGTIRNTYIGMLRILCKDAIYYNAVLDSLDMNCLEQSKLILDALEMGQIVNEYLADLTREVADLELRMKINIVTRKKSLEQFLARVKYFSLRLKSLAREDTDILLPVDHDPPKSTSHTNLLEEVKFMESTLTQLKLDTLQPNLDAILPAYENQMYQYLRLMKFRDVIQDYKAKLLHLSKHGEIMWHLVEHTYSEEKLHYLEEKRDLLKKINLQYKKDVELDNFYKENSDKLLSIRTGMNNISKILKHVERPFDPSPIDSETFLFVDVTGETSLELVPKVLTDNPKAPFTKILAKDEVEYLMDYNLKKMKILIDVSKEEEPTQKKRVALLYRHNATMQVVTAAMAEEEIDLCAGMIFEEKGVLNYKTAKIESALYVADNTVDELAVVAEQLKAMTKVRNPWIMAEMKLLKKKRKEKLKWDMKMRGEKI